MLYPIGHYYSPIISIPEVKQREEQIWRGASIDGLSGIDLNAEEQVSLVGSLTQYYHDVPFTKEKEHLRYYYNNGMFNSSDATLLYSMIRHYSPKRIIEIGSGFSSAVMLDTRQLFNNDLQLTFIDPEPQRLQSLLVDGEPAIKIIPNIVQTVDLSIFEELEENDILFIDGSHVSKTGSDVNHVLFEILPRLEVGVIIHFHDVFYPFEYPKAWVWEGRSWNENYILRAFLTQNNNYKIKLFNHYLYSFHREVFKDMAFCYDVCGGSLWIQKISSKQ